jgi:mannose-1-phosphate guanylyltransferase
MDEPANSTNVSFPGRAAIILAGGDGARLSEYTRKVSGFAVPKQFFAVLEGIPLLQQTRQRVSLAVAPARTFFLLNREHDSFFSPMLAEVPQKNLIVQPRNRGTAPAILYALLRIVDVMPRASVVLMPSDHHVRDEPGLMEQVGEAFEAVELHPELTVLLGAKADEPESAYGWVEPGLPLNGTSQNLFQVQRFWEKPSRELATELMANGCLWSSFIIVARVSTLLRLFVVAMPKLYLSFSKMQSSLRTNRERECVDAFYQRIQASDFSRHVLERSVENLGVLRMRDVGWSDLGDPRRVAKALADSWNQKKWDAA